MNKLQHMNFKNNNIRFIKINEIVWFSANDVSKSLGYVKPNKAVKDHVTNHNILTLKWRNYKNTNAIDLWGKNDYSNKKLVNKSGIYSLMLSSKLQDAIKFYNWVVDEVLPSLDEKGYYSMQDKKAKDLMNAPLSETYKRMYEIQLSNEKLKKQNKYYDKFMQNKGLITTTSVAQKYGMSARKLHSMLHDLRIMYKKGKTWCLYKTYQGKGYADYYKNSFNNNTGISLTLKWTTKGEKMIYDKLKGQKILPDLDQPNLLDDGKDNK